MDSKIFATLALCISLAACVPPASNGVFGNEYTGYWHQTRLTADNVPDIVKAQDFLEQDLAACGYEKRARNHMAAHNDPVSTEDGHVVDEKGTDRKEAGLPTSYEVRDCMERKGWVQLKHYYTIPY